MAKSLGKEEDFKLFAERSKTYVNVWNFHSKFFAPRKEDGNWLETANGRQNEIVTEGSHSYYKYFDPLLVGRRPNRHYTESNAWQYIWSVQHDIPALINLFGGKKQFAAKLDTFFTMSPAITPPKYVGVVGTIGQYVHGNQPSHHVAYLYNYAAQPEKTQQRVRQIMDNLYRPGPGGLCGNEDMGSLSSWYVLSALGIYPVAPGSNEYALGSPVFNEVTLHISDNKWFTIRAENNSKENIYVKSVTLNKKPVKDWKIRHEDIMKGGEMVFQMMREKQQ
jgi:predicted alpha-1,2-mannosidase